MQGLKVLVIVLGVLLVAGMLALIGGIVWRGGHPLAPLAETAPEPFIAPLDLPQGARILTMQAAGERLLLHVVLPDHSERIVIVDLDSGAWLGTIELQPTP